MEELRSIPQQFSLFAAIRALEALHSDRPRIGEGLRASSEHLRFSQSPQLEFASNEIKSLTERGTWRLEQCVFGVFGPNGALPLHLTELAAERARHYDDSTMLDFINIFQHRSTSLFYRAWAESEPAAQADRPDDDRFRLALAALIGLDSPSALDRDAVADGAKFARAGLLASSVRSVDALETLLSDYFELDIQVRCFVPRWLDIPSDARSRLGGTLDGATLGQGAMLGTATMQATQSFEISIGPVNLGVLNQFLPGSAALRVLQDLVRLFTNDEWQWQIRILVNRDCVQGAMLGTDCRLGWTGWLGERLATDDEVVIQADQLHGE